jgi:hypothetical protein
MKVFRFVFIFFSGIVLLLYCRLEPPQAPRWRSNLQVPLVDTVLTVENVLDSYDQAFFYADGMLGLKIDSHLDTTFIRDYFILPNVYDDFTLGVTDINLPRIVAGTSRFFFSELYSGAAGLHNQDVIVPAFEFNNVTGNRLQNPDFQSADIRYGAATAVFHNRLPVDLYDVVLYLKDMQSGDILLKTDNPIQVESQDSVKIELQVSNIRIDSQTAWMISGKSNGSGNNSVNVSQEDGIDLYLVLESVVVSAVEADLPALQLDREQHVVFGQAYQIMQVGMKSGTLHFNILNQMPFDIDIVITTQQIYKENSDAFIRLPINLQAGKERNIELDISDYVIDLTQNQFFIFSDLVINVSGEIKNHSDQIVRLDESTDIDVSVALEDLNLEYIEGAFDHQRVELDSMEEKVEFDQFGDLSGVTLKDAKLVVDIFSTLSVPIKFQGQVWGIAGNGNKSLMHFSEQIQLSDGDGEMHTQLPVYTPENSDILPFVNLQPEKIIAFGSAWIGDGTAVGRINGWDYIRAEYTLEIPAHLTLQERRMRIDTMQYQILPADYAVEENSAITQIDAGLSNRLYSANIKIISQNKLPLGAQLCFYFAQDSAKLFRSPDMLVGPVRLDAAGIDQAGKARDVVVQKFELIIPAEKSYLFKNEGRTPKNLFVATQVILADSGEQAIQVFDSDYIQLSALIDIKIEVDF